MVENLAVYLTKEGVEWKAALPGSTTNGGFMKKVTEVEWPTDEGTVHINLMQGVELKSHLQGLAGFVQQTTNDIELQQEALAFVAQVRLCLGVQLPGPVEFDGPTIQRLKNVAGVHGGALFIDNNLLKNGRYIAGDLSNVDDGPEPAPTQEPVRAPVASDSAPAPMATGTAAATAIMEMDPLQSAPESQPTLQTDRRARTLAHLQARGFRSAPLLPVGADEAQLRPATEIAARLGAASLAYLWSVAPPEYVGDQEVQAGARAADVVVGHTPKTQTILSTPRAQAQQEYGPTIGWSLENMWALAWVLGFDHDLQIDSGMIGDEPSVALRSWMPIHGRTVTSVLAAAVPRPVTEVADRADIFYCAHNAVRSAQAGDPTAVPEGFDPRTHGGTVHERRHGLVWSLSPGKGWDDTDLSA